MHDMGTMMLLCAEIVESVIYVHSSGDRYQWLTRAKFCDYVQHWPRDSDTLAEHNISQYWHEHVQAGLSGIDTRGTSRIIVCVSGTCMLI